MGKFRCICLLLFCSLITDPAIEARGKRAPKASLGKAALRCGISVTETILENTAKAVVGLVSFWIALKLLSRYAPQLTELVPKINKTKIQNNVVPVPQQQQAQAGGPLTGQMLAKLKQMIDTSDMPDAAREVANRELWRLKNEGHSTFSKDHIEWLCKYPWKTETVDTYDFKKMKEIFDTNIYGYNEVKERLFDNISLRAFQNKKVSKTICLVGPPGVGKTVFAELVATALGRKFERIVLGGMADEPSLRGYHKSYQCAKPGAIFRAIVRAKTKNPVILLDECDKMSASHHGDPRWVLLEALDPSQNDVFNDNYLETPINLADVMFIATANSMDAIPQMLLDRMTVIEVPVCSVNDKEHIVPILLSKVMKEIGGNGDDFKISAGMIKVLIEKYTSEAGVRQLERVIREMVSRVLRQRLEGSIKFDDQNPCIIEEEDVMTALIRGQALPERPLKKIGGSEVGVFNGLGVSWLGGSILPVEARFSVGTGNVSSKTGQIMSVMNESLEIAYRFVKANEELLAVEKGFFDKHDLEVHIPEGAISKDGPSAGIAFVLAIASAATGIPVAGTDTATGEVTQRGIVNSIGAVREKILAAKEVGAKRIFVPEGNRRQVESLDCDISGIEIIYVSNVIELMKKMFSPKVEDSGEPATLPPTES
ncbi:AAA family ATPase [bacterium]|nr:AAA family ATPase [bacterium]